MGCGVSKQDIGNVKPSDNPPKQLVGDPAPAAKKDEQEDEIQVLQPGKNIPKSNLDDIVRSRNPEKGAEEASTIINVSYTLKNSKTEVSNTNPVKEKEPDENLEAEEVIDLNKSKTINKIGFESHPHNFDFSFIEEKSKAENETDNITDQILKEISEIS
jgi:hypothetical protein